jgi:SAM-dependent methyltransferase
MSVDWDRRYFQQSLWTKPLRDYLVKGLSIPPTSRVLEVGCGTGVICSDFENQNPCIQFGLDINFDCLRIATRNNPKIGYICGDALSLPFQDGTFDLVFCHYFLLWVSNPDLALQEIKRVLHSSGTLLVFAEPDHMSRIDAPVSLEFLGRLQTDSLIRQGADVSIGRKIPSLLSDAGFSNIEYGISGFQIRSKSLPEWWQSEWAVLFDDLHEMIEENELLELQKMDKSSWESGSRVLWVPTFYARCMKY